METKNHQARDRISWHPAFFEAIQMELDDYSQELSFIPEYQLTTEPLCIDIVIIKKSGDKPIKKNIASIFRKENIVEYKSPHDYLSTSDFYKVYAYACLYASINKFSITNLTISFIASRYPRKLLKHLQCEHGYTVAETSPGIYTVTGDILPIQIIDSRKLPEEENLWLRSLSDKHDGSTLARLDKEISKKGKTERLQAYLYAIITANYAAAKEAVKMGKKFDQFVEETGLAARWEARGEARGRTEGRVEVARNALAEGASPDFIQRITGLDIKTIKRL
jgi:hypothetical protein